jgi:hypothetical protein
MLKLQEASRLLDSYAKAILNNYKRREQGIGRNTHLHQFRASVKKKMFLQDA